VSDLDYAQERDMDARFEAHQDLIAEDQEQAERLGFAEGDKVTVGKGKKVWIIHSFFSGYDPGVPLARLEPVLGFSATSVTVDRLRAVTA
jgi:hypothetical protein